MPDEENHAGIPTRAIHESYLDMQRSLKRYRKAKDKGSAAQFDDAHGDVQEAVLTFYEMLRPHIKNNDGVQGYWNGELPRYDGNQPPDPEEGKGVLQVQQHNQNISWDKVQFPEDVEVEDLQTLKDWHEVLGLNGSVRLTQVHPNEDGVFVSQQRYQLGMRELDSWETKYQTRQTTIGGFLGGTLEEKEERIRVDMPKLKRAARELSDVAKEMGYLPQDAIQDNDDALPI